MEVVVVLTLELLSTVEEVHDDDVVFIYDDVVFIYDDVVHVCPPGLFSSLLLFSGGSSYTGGCIGTVTSLPGVTGTSNTVTSPG